MATKSVGVTSSTRRTVENRKKKDNFEVCNLARAALNCLIWFMQFDFPQL